MRIKNYDEVVSYIENRTVRKLTEDELLLVGIGFDLGLVEGREREKEEKKTHAKSN